MPGWVWFDFTIIIISFISFILWAASKNGYSLDSLKLLLADSLSSQKLKDSFSKRLGFTFLIPALVVVPVIVVGAKIFDKIEPPPPSESEPLPLRPVHSVRGIFSDHFLLSDIKGSVLLELANNLLGDGSISADALDDGKSVLENFFEEQAHSNLGFPLPKNMNLPDSETVYSFDTVKTVEECVAEIRGVVELLDNRLDFHVNEPEEQLKIVEYCYHLTIRSMDANYLGHQDSESRISNQETWMYAEYAFTGLVNGYIYDKHEDNKLLDMYYRTAQLFDYLGTIADTEEQAREMYFAALVCCKSAFDILESNGFQADGSEYGRDTWKFYVELLYRLLLKVEYSGREGFFLLMKEAEIQLLASSLAEESEISNVFDNYELYKKWGSPA